MKVISIGNDPKIFQAGSAVQKRQIEYGKMFEELYVFSRSGGESDQKISSNVSACPMKFSKIGRLFRGGGYTISTQDPFEHGVIGVWFKLLYGVPLQIQLHTDFRNRYFLFSSPLNFVRFFLAHLTLPFADGVRVVSDRVARSVQELNKNITVLPIRVEWKEGKKERRKDLNKKDIRILAVCRLEKEKDLETAIKAFKIVSEKYPDATFTIAGEGSQKAKLQNLSKILNLESKIQFVGWVNDLPNLYAEHDIYLSTSLFEGYGMSIVEAAQFGLALVLSDAGIANEIPGALVCKPKDIKCLGDKLVVLLNDHNLVIKAGNDASNWASSHVISKEKYLALYQRSLEDAFLPRLGNFISRIANYVASIFGGNKALRFIVSGGTAALTQITSLYVFTDVLSIYYLYSSVLSYIVAIVVSFILQKFWAFQDKDLGSSHIQFAKYVLVGILGLATNTLSMYVLVSVLGVWYIVAQIISGAFIAGINFFCYKNFIFKK